MKHMKKVAVPATTKVVVDRVTCDLCGKVIDAVRGSDVDEIEVRHRTGFSYSDGGGGGEETSVDLCGACFDEKLVPWLRSQGAEPRTEEWGC